VSQGLKVKGEISGRGDLYLDGTFEGTIHTADGRFTVGPNARVTAEIEAREVIVHGEVIGTLKGERVLVSSTGRVTGDMESAALSSKMAQSCAARSKVVKRTNRSSHLLRRFLRAPRRPPPRAGRRPKIRSSDAEDFLQAAW
jgi:hypothetical protein